MDGETKVFTHQEKLNRNVAKYALMKATDSKGLLGVDPEDSFDLSKYDLKNNVTMEEASDLYMEALRILDFKKRLAEYSEIVASNANQILNKVSDILLLQGIDKISTINEEEGLKGTLSQSVAYYGTIQDKINLNQHLKALGLEDLIKNEADANSVKSQMQTILLESMALKNDIPYKVQSDIVPSPEHVFLPHINGLMNLAYFWWKDAIYYTLYSRDSGGINRKVYQIYAKNTCKATGINKY